MFKIHLVGSVSFPFPSFVPSATQLPILCHVVHWCLLVIGWVRVEEVLFSCSQSNKWKWKIISTVFEYQPSFPCSFSLPDSGWPEEREPVLGVMWPAPSRHHNGRWPKLSEAVWDISCGTGAQPPRRLDERCGAVVGRWEAPSLEWRRWPGQRIAASVRCRAQGGRGLWCQRKQPALELQAGRLVTCYVFVLRQLWLRLSKIVRNPKIVSSPLNLLLCS